MGFPTKVVEQNEQSFDSSNSGEGTHTDGTGYAVNDKIVLSDGSVWNVASLSGSAVNNFDLLKTGTQGVGGVALTQVYTTGAGTGFSVTPSATYTNNANLGHPSWRHVVSMRVSKVETDARMMFYHYAGILQSSQHQMVGSWWDTDLGYQDILGGFTSISNVNTQWRRHSTNGSGTGFTNQRRLQRRMTGVSPNDDRFALVVGNPFGVLGFTRDDLPVWLTYRQGTAGIVNPDGNPSNSGRSPALTFNEDPTVTGGSTYRNQNQLEFGTNDSGEEFLLWITRYLLL